MNKPIEANRSDRPRSATAGSGTRPSVSARFENLARETSVEGWDDEGGAAIAREQWDAARRLVEKIRHDAPGTPDVYPSACGDGSIHLRWSDASRALDAEVAGGEYHWCVRTDEVRERDQSSDALDLMRALRKLFP